MTVRMTLKMKRTREMARGEMKPPIFLSNLVDFHQCCRHPQTVNIPRVVGGIHWLDYDEMNEPVGLRRKKTWMHIDVKTKVQVELMDMQRMGCLMKTRPVMVSDRENNLYEN